MRPACSSCRSLPVVAVVLAWFGTTPTLWGGVALSDLITNNGSVISGDKLFDQFSYSATGDMPSSSGVQIIPVQYSGNYGIRVFGGFNDFSGGGASTATLSYRVSVTDPNLAINGATLFGNPAVLNQGIFTIEASFAALPPSSGLMIYDQVPGGAQLADEVDFDSIYPSVEVQLSLTGNSTSAVGAVTLSFVDQALKQGVVPEPSSLLIWMGSAMLFGMVTVVYRRRLPLAMPADRTA